MKSKIVESQADLYRFYPLPGNLITELKRDRIDITKEMSIQDILAKKIQREKMIAEKLGEPVVDIQEKDLPEPYFSLYKIKHALTDNKLYAADIASFNDIHEQIAWVKVDSGYQRELYEKSISDGQYKGTWEEFQLESKGLPNMNNGYLQHDWAKAYPGYGVVCFCQNWNHQLMWGHYANGHYGIVIGYRINQRLKDAISSQKITVQRYLMEDKTTFSFLFSSIRYFPSPSVWFPESQDFYRTQYLELCRKDPMISKLIGESDYMTIAANMFLKSDAWEDEREVRMGFLGTPRSISIEKLIYNDQREPYIEISEVICGNKVDNEIIALLKNSQTPKNLPFKKAQPKGGTFECELVEI